MKISVIGGGGVRALFLAKSLAMSSRELGITETVFMDTSGEQLAVFGKLAECAAERLAPEMKFSLTTDAVCAVKNADYIITTIRAGGDEMRVRDERIALDQGVLGQETTGAAGFSFAMRSVPALAEYCELAKQYASPDVKIFNFTNPAGVVSQTLRDMGYDFTYGICDAPTGLLRSVAELYHVPPDAVEGDCYGLNHLSFFSSIRLNGRELLPDLLENDRLYAETDMKFFEKDLVLHTGKLLNEYLYYYYYREEAVANILRADATRGEVIRGINRQLRQALSEIDIEQDFDRALQIFEYWYGKREDAYMSGETGTDRGRPPYRFDLYAPDFGGYAGVALQYIRAMKTGRECRMILCVPNGDAIPWLRDTDVVEVSCLLKEGNCVPLRTARADETEMALIQSVKSYERLASEAIRTKSRKRAADCLMVHPLVNSYSRAKKLAEEYLKLNREYSGEWS